MKEFIQGMVAKTNWMKSILGMGILSAFLFQCWFLSFYQIPEGNEGMFHVLFGIIDTNMIIQFNYHYGSSKGSQDKQRTIDKINDEKNNS